MKAPSGYDYDLGSFHRAVSTRSSAAQVWFDRGLAWCYGFHHEEAVRCFEQAIQVDPTCLMAYWGLAYSLGPNYNVWWGLFDPAKVKSTLRATNRALDMAKECDGSPVEKALVRALSLRFPSDAKEGDDPGVWNRAYAAAMEKVYEEFKDDPDIAAVYADSLIGLTPWKLWDLRTGEPTEHSKAIEARMVLEAAMSLHSELDHPGLLHFYVHLMEMSNVPEVALPFGDRLENLVPDAGHLLHMPAHLDILVGDYRRAISHSVSAIKADEKWLNRFGAQDFYALYRLHNYHTLIYAALFAGQSAVALSTVEKIEESIYHPSLSETLIESNPDWTETFAAIRVHVLVRFGRWQEIIDYPLPSNPELHCVTTAFVFYAKGVAYAATGQIEPAEKMQYQFDEALKRVPRSRLDFPNKSIEILAVAKSMLAGELEYRRGNYDLAFQHLRKAIELDDGLSYAEPWGWMQPVRHAYAALKLEQGDVQEACRTYAEDLGFDSTIPRARHHPNNVWALYGYHECLVKLGRHDEARVIEQPLKIALAYADVEVKSSCYCKATERNETSDCCS
ncbi:MAG: hypothetical protein TREMPRED_003784 [Tremellales sp. Tagirdzhanova-0007]|nr:MAG: hypothetical protein TREMPRED_003784 [Tremellales sp. Tagirdzhanova-0007]